MHRRHPHLFDLGPVEDWEELKRRERRKGRESAGALAGLPPTLPGLLLAYRLQERAATVGFDWPDAEGPMAKVSEELAEVAGAIQAERAEKAEKAEKAERAERAERAGRRPELQMPSTGEPVYPPTSESLVDEIGDLLFAVVNLARKARVQPHVALDRANRKFCRRFEAVERLAAERGIEVPTAGLEVLDGLWEEVKKQEKGEGRQETGTATRTESQRLTANG